MKNLKVLLIDDEPTMLMTYDTVFRMKGIRNIGTCLDPMIGLEKVKSMQPDVILLDLMMGPYRGEDFIETFLSIVPKAKIIIVSALDTIETAVKCIRLGALDYMVKPLDKERLFKIIEGDMKASEKDHVPGDSNLWHHSAVMANVLNQVSLLAATPYPILVTGETGTGKELVAKDIHTKSGRTGELVCLNVAGLDENMFSDTLFGHRKGAFTGADQAREGMLVKAEGGTLFLDEIGDLDSRSQVKLLRLLQEEEFYPVGSDQLQKSNTRFVMATHVDLPQKVKDGTFREDLYYRLSSQWVQLPPLRERPGEVPYLAELFNDKICKELRRATMMLPDHLMLAWQSEIFPGNVRELEGRVRQYILTGKDIIPSMGIRESITAVEIDDESGELLTLKEMTDKLIDEAMERADGKQTEAAKLLGISQQALSARLKKRKWG